MLQLKIFFKLIYVEITLSIRYQNLIQANYL